MNEGSSVLTQKNNSPRPCKDGEHPETQIDYFFCNSLFARFRTIRLRAQRRSVLRNGKWIKYVCASLHFHSYELRAGADVPASALSARS